MEIPFIPHQGAHIGESKTQLVLHEAILPHYLLNKPPRCISRTNLIVSPLCLKCFRGSSLPSDQSPSSHHKARQERAGASPALEYGCPPSLRGRWTDLEFHSVFPHARVERFLSLGPLARQFLQPGTPALGSNSS